MPLVFMLNPSVFRAFSNMRSPTPHIIIKFNSDIFRWQKNCIGCLTSPALSSWLAKCIIYPLQRSYQPCLQYCSRAKAYIRHTECYRVMCQLDPGNWEPKTTPGHSLSQPLMTGGYKVDMSCSGEMKGYSRGFQILITWASRMFAPTGGYILMGNIYCAPLSLSSPLYYTVLNV